VPIATKPGWLQAFAKVNPLTPMADVTRSLMLGGGIADSLWKILVWDISLILPFTFLAFRRYNRLS
jgi:oleandomycin transport system permease protein